MSGKQAQDSVSDVERLRSIIHNDAILFGQIEQRMRECWIGTGKLCDDGSASNDFRVWMNEAHNRQRDLKAALGQNPNLPLAALAVPINKIGEDARTYADGVEDALRQAAAICDNHAEPTDTPGQFTDGYERAATRIGAAIRRLSTSTDKGVR